MLARSRVRALTLLLPALAAGCAQPQATPAGSRVAHSSDGSEAIRNDPVAFLRTLKARCDTLEQYRLTFYRQERLGLIPKLSGMEKIRAAFRKSPFSVKFEWPDEDMPYYESVYVAGANGDRLVIRERKGLFPFPPQVRMVDIDLPVKLHKAINPITSFGLAQLAGRTLAPFEDPKLVEVMDIRYEGIIQLEPMNRPAHHLRITRPPTPGYRYTKQDFYVDTQTGWPAGTDLWLPDGQLDARYRYADIDPAVQLSDADFRLSQDHPADK